MSFAVHGLAWDTEYFGFPCANIDISGTLSDNDAKELVRLSRQYRFITIHNPDALIGNEKTILSLPNTIKTDVNIRLCSSDPAGIEGAVSALPLEIKEGYSVVLDNNMPLSPDVFDAVQGSFVHSRFYQDKHITTEKADGVFYNWLKNAQNRPDKYFCICRYQGRCAGVMLLSFIDKKSIVIELLSVCKTFQNTGIGTLMMRRLGVFRAEKNVTKILVGTQERNSAALAFYKKNNFKTDRKTHIYHMWNN